MSLINIVFCVSHYELYLQLLGEMVGHYGGEGGEQGSQEDADVTDVNGDVEKMQDVIQDGRGDHKSW